MKWGPVQPARDGIANGGSLPQAQHVFLRGNGLPERWAGRSRFVVLDTGFGLGDNFLATWAAWRDDPMRPQALWYVAIEQHPPRRPDLLRAHAASALPALAQQLIDAWPCATPDLHPLRFEGGRLRLLLAFGDPAAVLPDLVAQVDAFYLGGFAPDGSPGMRDRHLLQQRLPRLAAPGATAATWSVARELREGLAGGGFVVEAAPGMVGKREITVARHAPRFLAPLPPGRRPALDASATGNDRQAVVIGAGLAGSATAWALQAQGVQCTVLEAGPGPAHQTSGNPGGLLHATVHADDGPHARWLRAAALLAHRTLAPWVAAGRLPGQLAGLLRLEERLDTAQMRYLLQRLGWPEDFVQAVDAAQAGTLAGTSLSGPAWFYPGAGWVDPSVLCRLLLRDCGADLRLNANVQRLHHNGRHWQALDARDQVLAQAPVLVLANAHGLTRLWPGAGLPPLLRSRGQVTVLPAQWPGLPPLRLPVAGNGYALALPDGRLLTGASNQIDDEDPSLRTTDHRHNLQRLQQLTGGTPALDDASLSALHGRVGWRLSTPDRLPLVGACAAAPAPAPPARARPDQSRLVPRAPGLFMHTALGSRGISQSLLGAELLAAWVTGAPWPVPGPLADAVDPVRYLSRQPAAGVTGR